MNLSITERLILINQYEILKRLDEGSRVDYDYLIEILTEGYTSFYSEFNQGISDEVPAEVQRFVFDILGVYRSIEYYKQENPQDQQVKNHLWNHFQGFDGNDEMEYCSFVRFLIDKADRFVEQIPYRNATDNFNHHFPTLYKYRAMITQWKELEKKLITQEAVMQVLDAE